MNQNLTPPPYTPWLAPAPPRKIRTGTVAVVAGATLLAGALGGGVGALLGSDDPPAAAPTSAVPTAQDKTTDVSAVVEKVAKSVVEINGRAADGTILGSGVIIGSDGRILTNNHVVANTDDLTVTLADGKKVGASVVATDPERDLAIIQADGVSGLTAATFADSDSVNVGDEVIAIGSPLGLQGSVTTGIVSALNREVTVPGEQERSQFPLAGNGSGDVSYRAIQTDASINRGNSGGPLFNSAGEVIGINSAMYSPVSGSDGSAGSVGIGFAIPSNDAKKVIDQL